jgi:hypothetical protein
MMAPTIDMTAAGLEELAKRISNQCSSTHPDSRTPSQDCSNCSDVNGILMISTFLKDVEAVLYKQLDEGLIDEKELDDEFQKQCCWAKKKVESVLIRAEIRGLMTQVERLEIQGKLWFSSPI